MADVRCAPIDHWHGPQTPDWERHRAPYSAGWARVLDDLDGELEYLDATDVVLGLDLKPSEIRLDGWPRANATPPPPVVLTFQTPTVGALRFQCDRWDNWRGNVRAIGLTLRRLRLVDEGGCTRSGEQYQGWAALPPAREAGPAQMTVETAAAFMALHAWGPDIDPQEAIDDPAGAYRAAAKVLHPDAGGDPALFLQLKKAKAVVTRHQEFSQEGHRG